MTATITGGSIVECSSTDGGSGGIHAGAGTTLTMRGVTVRGCTAKTMGGGLGQSRICMLMIGTCHIGEVQVSIWDEATRKACRDAGITLL